jgi:hypothetical protein
MLAMDVVDTLRHRERLVERELNEEVREEQLIDRLRTLYKSQGAKNFTLDRFLRWLSELRESLNGVCLQSCPLQRPRLRWLNSAR